MAIGYGGVRNGAGPDVRKQMKYLVKYLVKIFVAGRLKYLVKIFGV